MDLDQVRNPAAARRRFRRKSGAGSGSAIIRCPSRNPDHSSYSAVDDTPAFAEGWANLGRRRVESDRRGSRGQDADKAALPRGDKSVRGTWVVMHMCKSSDLCALGSAIISIHRIFFRAVVFDISIRAIPINKAVSRLLATVRWLRARERRCNHRRQPGFKARLERIARTPEVEPIIEYPLLRLIARKRRFRVIRTCVGIAQRRGRFRML